MESRPERAVLLSSPQSYQPRVIEQLDAPAVHQQQQVHVQVSRFAQRARHDGRTTTQPPAYLSD
jgi:hypothetical protein